MIRRFVTALAGVAALALVGAGCGGGDKDSGVSKAEFVKEASAVCAERIKQIGTDLRAAGQKGASPDAGVEAILSNLGEEAKELEALEAPAGDEARVEAIVRSLRKGLQEAEAEASKGNALFNAKNQMVKAGEEAKKYGLEQCASLF